MPRATLSSFPVEVLHAEIQRRAKKAAKAVAKLVRQRAKIDKQIADLEALAGPTITMAPKGSRKVAKGGRKPKVAATRATGKPLAEYVKQVLSATDKGLTLKEIEKKVLAAGYPTTAASIYKPIMSVLGKGFKRVKRGVYAVEAAVMKAMAAPAEAAVAVTHKAKGKRKKFSETATQFLLGMVKGKGASTAEINVAWKKAGRSGTADVSLSQLTKAGKLKREPLTGKKGSTYKLA